jgi:hypothetical protein
LEASRLKSTSSTILKNQTVDTENATELHIVSINIVLHTSLSANICMCIIIRKNDSMTSKKKEAQVGLRTLFSTSTGFTGRTLL